MRALILAAGQGKRLGKASKNRPKCLVELFGKTIKLITLKFLERYMDFLIEYFNSIVGALAAIGAVASIYYLIQEMREQNRVARANARQNVADSHQEIALDESN